MQSASSLVPRKPAAASSLGKPSSSGRCAKPNRPQPTSPVSKTSQRGTAGRYGTSTALVASTAASHFTAGARGQSTPFVGQGGRTGREGFTFGLRAPQDGAAGAAAHAKKRQATKTKVVDDANAPVVVVGPERDSVPFRLCCEALAEGCVQTYMHLFELAHRDPVCVDTLSRKFFNVPDDRLAWVQQQLSAVEVLRRQSEFEQVFTHCAQLADYFESEGDYAEAAWYHEMALHYMMESLDRTLEQRARHVYAAFQERQGHLEEAAALYGAMYRLAVALRDEAALQDASRCLVRVHQALGETLKFSDPAAAARHYATAAEAAVRGKNVVDEGVAYSALGDVSEARGDLPLALKYQRSCRAVAQKNNLKPQECHATLRVADLEERLGLKLEASTTLQEALQLAKELGAPRQLCIATMQLGEAYRSRNQEDEALQCFDESFSAAIEAGDQELIDTVRIAMGFARGDYYLTHAYGGKGYLHLVYTDIRAQLAWMSGGTL
ncbi:conserved hypothetical protein [Leishmania mexicana MHOM/GT/2001/U1103]|uniref:Tetratricopeptide repeat protein 29 n=1 Tax=Leishmania mexicana (strain MHOM/GT/2001/U1103) TaxID=929439 RepID=E9AXS4_LEIMU|nr:conserved hypothetical protein [Leishmania mexicana MHOM/GT/2001/U1103]CBZ27766.1 conserved hypothetical protein [Leishmania mexicana MHOM/GT/2001/U1103]